MPLLLVTGYPSCGKSTICKRIVEYFKQRNFGEENMHIVADEVDLNKIHDFKMEKEFRNAFRAKVQHLLDKNNLVICDSLNHIKGYRYELYCLAKNNETRYAVVHCKTIPAICKWLNSKRKENERFSDDQLEVLFRRYEEPNPKNRWDAPLFIIPIGPEDAPKSKIPTDDLSVEELIPPNFTVNINDHIEEGALPRNVQIPLEQLYSSLIEGKQLSANKCMKSQAPLTSSTFLTELDNQTKTIVSRLLESQRMAMPGDKLILLEDARAQTNRLNFSRLRSLPELTRTRQQFITFMKSHPVDDLDSIGPLFVDYLNSNS